MSFSYWQTALDSRLRVVDGILHKDDLEPDQRLVRMQLELEARAMRSMISQLNQKLNKLCRASDLPSAALQRIFLILSAYESVPNETWPTRTREHCHWTKVLDICRTWREAALACPHLWSSHPLGLGSARFNAFMARSRDSPINLRLGDAGELPATLLSETLQEPDDYIRIATLESTVRLGEDALQALTGCAPLLETLRIVPAGILQEQESMNLPDGLLGGQAPRLRHLALRGFSTFFSQIAIVTNIVSLNISRGVDHDSYTRPSWPILRLLLEALVNIDELILHGCLPVASKSAGSVNDALELDNAQTPDHAPSDLLHLRSLDVSGELEALVRLFESITLQPTCVLRVQLRDPRSNVHGMTESLSTSGFRPSHGEYQPRFRSMRIITRKSEKARKILHIGLFSDREATLVEPCPFVVEVDHYSNVQPLDILEKPCLPIQGLRTIYLGADIAMTSHHFIMPMRVPLLAGASHKVFAFSDCAQVTSIYTEGGTGKSLVKALDNALLFPALQCLLIARGLDFEGDYKEELMITWKVLHRTLTARKEAGRPIASVLLPSEILEEYWIERMRDTGTHFKPIVDASSDSGSKERGLYPGDLLTITDDPSSREY
ncbi:unnamed protein product [Peniophora sp. CBMAI 1063]|nr:unnamed protein product [Peniophora sp. CBMAI 1063]